MSGRRSEQQRVRKLLSAERLQILQRLSNAKEIDREPTTARIRAGPLTCPQGNRR